MHFLDALVLFEPLDIVGFALFALAFPIYHGLYPWLMRLFPDHAAKVRFDLLRRSWIEGIVARREIVVAAQQTRNLTMVNSLLGSSSLILMGVTANIMIGRMSGEPMLPNDWGIDPRTTNVKLLLLIAVFAVAFAYCMTALRHLGHFNLVIGADPQLVEEMEGSSTDYFSALINRASTRYTLAVRCLYSASPLFMWLFDTWMFIALTLFWSIKFVGFQDFAHVLRSRAARVSPAEAARRRRRQAES